MRMMKCLCWHTLTHSQSKNWLEMKIVSSVWFQSKCSMTGLNTSANKFVESLCSHKFVNLSSNIFSILFPQNTFNSIKQRTHCALASVFFSSTEKNAHWKMSVNWNSFLFYFNTISQQKTNDWYFCFVSNAPSSSLTINLSSVICPLVFFCLFRLRNEFRIGPVTNSTMM